MKWNKLGQVYSPPFDGSWKDNSALTPTAFVLNPNVIRVYCSFRDVDGVGRIGFVDVDSENPIQIIQVSSRPVLDVGAPGMFDDNGLILGDVIEVDNQVFMYFVGFQLVKKVKFLAFSGLAVSSDGGESFARVNSTPVLDRSVEGSVIRAIHSVSYDNDKFRVWYAVGSDWEDIDGRPFPRYSINYQESLSGMDFQSVGTPCIKPRVESGEYRIGRPRVYQKGAQCIMNFTYGTRSGKYMAGQATSIDGRNWIRDDSALGISLSESGWDSRHLSYPSVVCVGHRTFMFYNGNDMGLYGFGVAELVYET